jgi:hypothetical protein
MQSKIIQCLCGIVLVSFPVVCDGSSLPMVKVPIIGNVSERLYKLSDGNLVEENGLVFGRQGGMYIVDRMSEDENVLLYGFLMDGDIKRAKFIISPPKSNLGDQGKQAWLAPKSWKFLNGLAIFLNPQTSERVILKLPKIGNWKAATPFAKSGKVAVFGWGTDNGSSIIIVVDINSGKIERSITLPEGSIEFDPPSLYWVSEFLLAGILDGRRSTGIEILDLNKGAQSTAKFLSPDSRFFVANGKVLILDANKLTTALFSIPR